MGPEGTEELMSDDPWAEVRWMVDGFNEKRRKEFKVGWGVTVDETMIAWQGKSGPGGIPHMSCIHRKPDPLGCELKNACDCSSGSPPSPPLLIYFRCITSLPNPHLSGVMMRVEIQEGMVRMARHGYTREHIATTACTMRLAGGCGMGELQLAAELRPQRVLFADSWFASLSTTLALVER